MSKLRLIGDRQDPLALVCGQFVRRLTLLRRRLVAIGLHLSVLAPALSGPGRALEQLTGGAETGASGTGLMEMSDHVSALPEIDFPSSGAPRAFEFFFEYQQGGGLGQGLFFTSQLGLERLDGFRLLAQLVALDLGRDRGIGLEAGVSPSA